MTELRKCPFCGGEARTIPYSFEDFAVRCKECGCGTGIYDTEDEAIEAWNKRVGDMDWFQSLPTKDKEKVFKYISEKCQKCGEHNEYL